MQHPFVPAFCLALLCAHAGLAHAAGTPQWVQVMADGESTYALDATSVQSTGAVRNFWSLRDYKKPQSTYDGKAFLSAILKIEMDCQARQAQVLEITYFTGKALDGQRVGTEKDFHSPKPIEGNAPIERFAKRLCP